MNRKDTIMIAVILNAGLLVVLFATTLKTPQREKIVEETAPTEAVFSFHPPEVKTEIPLAVASSKEGNPKNELGRTVSSSVDEVEEAIKKYATPIPASSPVEVTPNFASDLHAITQMGDLSSSLAKPESTPSSEVTKGVKEIKVKKGDVLERIAKTHGVSVSEIMKLNKLPSARLKIGQVLKIPSSETKKTVPPTLSQEKGKFYTVKNGDNPWIIAVKNHMKVEDLLKLNNLDEEKARHLKAGDKLRISHDE